MVKQKNMLKKNTENKIKMNCLKNSLKFSFDETKFKIKIFLLMVVILFTIVILVISFYSFLNAFLICLAAFFVAIYGFLIFLNYKSNKRFFINQLLYKLELNGNRSFFSFPMPILVCSDSGIVLWYNDQLKINFEFEKDYVGSNFLNVLQNPLNKFCNLNGVEISHKNKNFKVYGTFFEKTNTYLLVFKDISGYVKLKEELFNSKICIAYVVIDNYREILTNKKDSEKSAIVGMVDNLIENFFEKHGGIMLKYREDEFFIVLNQKNLNVIIKNKFSILQMVKTTIHNKKNCDLTLSIGVGCETNNFFQCKKFAFQALDMALGRGGDQAAVKTSNSFKFFGGNSKELYKSSRVKARVVARALLELAKTCKNILVMGHRFGDLDSVGAAIGLTLALRKFNKNAFVALNKEQNLSKNLIEKVEQEGYNELILDLTKAIDLADEGTLLIVVDTHNHKLLDSLAIYEASGSVVIIDHHRKSIDCIENAVIFYHEPYASSTCELVCELIQHFCDEKIVGTVAAQSLLAGIMLDTKSFTIKVGVRTFEAAAYLKRLGANTIEVKKFFSSSISSYQKKAKVVMNSQIYKNCAIAISEFKSSDMRIIAPQAADELLGIAGIEASFVIFELFDKINITARSLGRFNVQVIMEHFNGGGHQMQAACQLENLNLQEAHEMLIKAIDEWLS